MARVGRRRKPNAIRDGNGISRDSRNRERRDYDLTLERRGRELKAEGINPVEASNQLSGTTLGRLWLRGPLDPGGISEEQYRAGNHWAWVIHRHSQVMGYEVKRTPVSPGFVMVGAGVSCAAEPSDEEIARVRERFRLAYDALMEACRDHGGIRVRDVVYGCCVENWEISRLCESDYGLLRIGLNAVARAIR